MYYLIKDGNIPNLPVKEFVCDSVIDIDSLPEAAPGSTAIVIDSGEVYMVNTSGKWVPFGSN